MIPNAKPQAKRPEPMTPEQAAEWDKRKFEQGQRLIVNEAEVMAAAGVSLSLVQTKRTFSIMAASNDFDFVDDLVFGDPAKTVPRDDRLFTLRAIDLTDEQIKAAFAEWRQRRKLSPPLSRVI